MATSRALELTNCPFHGVPGEVIAETDGAGLLNWGYAGNPEWHYVVGLCLFGHHFAAATGSVAA